MSLAVGGLWRNTDFVKLWAGQTVSQLGALLGALQFTALIAAHATPFQMALLAAAGVAPGLMLGPLAGVWVDRLRRRPILIGADMGRALLMASIPLAYFLHALRIEHLYAVSFLAGALTIFFDVSYRSYLPSLVSRKHLIEANSKLSASASFVEVCAFSLGGWLVQLFSAIAATVANAASFLVSALLVRWIRAREDPPQQAFAGPSMRKEVAEGLRFLLGEPLLRAIAVSFAARSLGGGMVGAMYLVYGIGELGFAPGVLGSIAAAGGISSVFGALIAGRVTRRFGIGPSMVAGALVDGLALLLIPLAQGSLVLAGALLVAHQLLGDAPATVHDINQMSLRQAITADHVLGRVNAAFELVGLTATLLGSLLAGALAETIGLRRTLVIAAGLALVGALWLGLSPVRKVRLPGRRG